MDEILQQLVPLLLRSIPTILIFLTVVLSYKFVLHDALLKVLAERRSRTEGAVERARAAIAAAEAKAQEYDAKLRAARAEIFQAREARVKAWNADRDSALASARHAAREQLHAAKAELDAQIEGSRQELQRGADVLVADILRAVLPGDSSAAVAGGPR
jgi:F-type H+-transporting ATPase subunit b